MVTARTKPFAQWRGDRWSGVVSRAIDSRLQRKREPLAALLHIDQEDREWRQHPKPFPPSPAGATSGYDPSAESGRYIAWRRSLPPGGGYVHRIDLAVEDLSTALRRCWNQVCEIDQKPSPAGARRRLNAIRRRPKQFIGRLDDLDPETLALLENAGSATGPGLDLNALDPDQLRAVAQAAIESAPPAKIGRPAGQNVSKRQLAADLAAIYWEYRGSRPGRVFQAETGRETGPFRDFVAEIWSMVPARLRKTQMGGDKTADHIVRIGVDCIAELERLASSRNR